MARIGRDELIKLARISQIALPQQDVETVMAVLEARLEYTTMLQDILAQHAHDVLPPEESKPNRFREDAVVKTDPEPLLAEAPQSEAHYFVVPVIIKQNV